MNPAPTSGAATSGIVTSWFTLITEGSIAIGFLYAVVRKTGPWVDWLLMAKIPRLCGANLAEPC